MDTYHRWMEVTVPGSLAGCPVINLPVGFNDQGLPMGMQIMGPATRDLSVLQLVAAYEQAVGWTKWFPVFQKQKPVPGSKTKTGLIL